MKFPSDVDGIRLKISEWNPNGIRMELEYNSIGMIMVFEIKFNWISFAIVIEFLLNPN